MNPIKILDDVYWVGGIDWNLRNFHGYLTQRGSTYNAYLIVDDAVTLIDTVKHYLTDEMLDRIAWIVDPSEIKYIVANHVEMDHSGALPRLMEICPDATIITSPQGEKGLRAHYRKDWNFKVVQSGEEVSIGARTLKFVLTPMVHWPDNMVCYSPSDKILFSNDAFGQHIATSERFDDQFYVDIIHEEAMKYYANIVLPYSQQVRKVLEDAATLDIEYIAPSHGIIWRSYVSWILEFYQRWAMNETDNKALIIYDTMWGSTEKIAYAIQKAFEIREIDTSMLLLKNNHMSDIMTEVLTARYICVGSPTLNKNMLPDVAAFLTYLKGLAPRNKVGLAFGSYGWGAQGVNDVDAVLRACDFDMIDKISTQYVPDAKALDEITKKVMEAL
ncbi:MAG TPA: FprA family A-type flavoprotein [Spirochaetota bacterium]|nr:FprA family A-type flavoprotein [Spirochaetota bacterium]HNT09876.1 FprA family A-type flavoprotein [Spirochaetota bacterium]HNV46285.1 FprA family A-type flavoprotein [Spirochaetota bacterium]HOS39948.1 FprA family A-type flavoprotein [Spirochaetota bacterium]HPU87131.1 FprA family A-type flavoprotein [Spirochaetota bacterium]